MTNLMRSRRVIHKAMLLVVAMLAAAPVFAQQQQQSPPGNVTPENQSKTAQQDACNKDDKDKSTNTQKNDRLFGVLPNYLTVENSGSVPPLSTGTKYKLVASGSFDPAEFAFVGFVALIGQASNSDAPYGQGLAVTGNDTARLLPIK